MRNTRPIEEEPHAKYPRHPETARPSIPAEEPILQAWNDGIALLDVKPSIDFAFWSDGTVIQRLNGHLYRGQLRPPELAALMGRVRNAGLFDGPDRVSWVRPDSGSRTIVARDGNRRIELTYDGTYDQADALSRITETASPSRTEVAAFLRRWHESVSSITAVAPEKLDRLGDDSRAMLPPKP